MKQIENDFLKLTEVLKLIPVSRSSWYLGMQDGYYPKPINIGPRAVAWLKSDIIKLIDNLKNGKIYFYNNTVADFKTYKGKKII